MINENVSADFPYESHYIDVYGSKMHYIEEGQGDPILLLHGMPTSSYLWRNIIPHLSPLGRCIAPDLMGMGKSDKPNIDYSIFDHIKYIEKFIELMNLKKIMLVLHGWGSIIGFDYAMRHESNIKGLIFYESYIRSLADDLSLPHSQQIFKLQGEKNKYGSVNQISLLVKELLTLAVLRTLTPEELAHYQEPFQAEGSGKPLFQYLKELCGKDPKVKKLISSYSKKLKQSTLPKLLLYAMPGFIMPIGTIMWAKEHLPNLEIIDVGEALHYAQETNPALFGETISVWIQGIEQQLGK